jgi:hypothetical protein
MAATISAAERQHEVERHRFDEGVVPNHIYAPGVTWGAVIAGSFVCAALSLILLALGAGLGMSAVSPWSNVGASAAAIGRGAILWIILVQILASSMGGYLAGRLRTKWARIHNDEVYFRDTAHGFLAWAVALVITAAFLTSAGTAMVGGPAAGGANESASISGVRADSNEYFADMVLRPNAINPNGAMGAVIPSATSTVTPAPNVNDVAPAREVGLIFANGLRQGSLAEADQAYLGQMVSARTGLSQPDAEKRVADDFAATQQAAETARKAIAHALLWIFVALLIGAFCASLSATFGGAQRDHVIVI